MLIALAGKRKRGRMEFSTIPTLTTGMALLCDSG